jgi:hypothetical protein
MAQGALRRIKGCAAVKSSMIHDHIDKRSSLPDGSGNVTLNAQAMNRIGCMLGRQYSELEAEAADLPGLTRLLRMLAEKDAAR